MRTRLLAFLDRLGHPGNVSVLREFWKLDEHELPVTGGVYILVADRWFSYPAGKSPVFYIGQSRNLRSRLTEHLRHARRAWDKRLKPPLFWPRYEFAGQFGKSYALVRTWQRMTPRALEEEAMAAFAREYFSFPIANGAGSWNRISKHFYE
jgi:hypothetical protein